MCIVLFTTAHPAYSLVLIDNRDEYILRPTSRPSWWRHPTSGTEVLSSRDLHRADRGTWLGISKSGALAVLTNYRELDPSDGSPPVRGARSRGRMATAWLGGLADDGVGEGVRRLVRDGGVAGVGGFSMVGGKLRRRGGAVAIVSNRARRADEVPVIGLGQQQQHSGGGGGTWGLSNTVFDDPDEWPKVAAGKRLLARAVDEAVGAGAGQAELTARLFAVLDTDTMPPRGPDEGFEACLAQLRHTIFVPAFGDEPHRQAMREARARGGGGGGWGLEAAAGVETAGVEAAGVEAAGVEAAGVEAAVLEAPPSSAEQVAPTAAAAFETGLYGTQRQTVLLVDWDGNATLVERALWDGNGNEVPRGQGDAVFAFQIDGWDE